MTRLELFRIKSMWGNYAFDYACSMARGLSGGLFSIWDPKDLEPSSIAKALEDPDWVAAMQEEMQQFINQKVWKLVPLPHGKHFVSADGIKSFLLAVQVVFLLIMFLLVMFSFLLTEIESADLYYRRD
ncbi:hypothetical protein Tco_0146482 [Tanacetum coccineum]